VVQPAIRTYEKHDHTVIADWSLLCWSDLVGEALSFHPRLKWLCRKIQQERSAIHVRHSEKANWSLCCGPGNFCYRFDSTSPARPNCAVATTLHHLFSGCFSRCLLPGVGSGCVSAGLVHHRRHDVGRSIRA